MTNNRVQKRAFAVSALALAIAAPLPVLAQGTLEEIIVSARKTDETLQSVPIAVSAFNADQMAAMNVTQTADVGRFTPSVFIEPPAGGNATSAKVTVRGQNQSDSLITLDPSVGWYLDDVYLARAYGTVASLYDAERVEVLKGPQGTLYGRNTTGGAIKVVTTKAEPSGGVKGYITGGVGNYDAWKVGGAVNIPLIEDVLAVRLVALKDTANGYGDVNVYAHQTDPTNVPAYLGTHDVGDRDTEMFRTNVTWLATDSIDVQLGYEHSKLNVSTLQRSVIGSRDALPVAGIPATTDFYKVNLNAVPRSKAKADTVNLTVNYDITDSLNSKLIYGWRRVDSSYMSDIDGTPTSEHDFLYPEQQYAKQQSWEWQISGTAADDHLDWMTGLYYFEEKGNDETFSYSTVAFQPNFTGIHTTLNDLYGSAKNTSQSAFVNGTLHLTEKLNFNGGLRYSKDKKPLFKRASSYAYDTGVLSCGFDPTIPGYSGSGSACAAQESADYEFISWSVGFDYQIEENMMAYIKSSKASRSGGQNVRGVDASSSAPFDPESATDIEIGFKSQLFDNSLRFNADVFHTFYEDIQQSLLFINPIYGAGTQVVNAAKADLDGFEFEATAAVTDNFTATLTGSLLNWKFDDDQSVLQSAPGQQYSLRLDYKLPVSIGQVNFSGNYSWRSDYAGNSNRATIRNVDAMTVDKLGLLNGRISLDIDSIDLTVGIWGNNLTDESYTTSPLNLGNVVMSTVGEPRMYGLDVTKKF
jgi:iron complex outermembrane receptor protein